MVAAPRIKVVVTLVAALSLSLWAFMYHQAHHAGWGVLDGINSGLSFAMVLLSFGSAWLFVDGLRHFKIAFQQAYQLLRMGIVFFGIAQVQFGLLVTIIGWSFWLDSGLITLPYLMFALFIYLAMRRFAYILGLKPFAASLRVTIAIATSVAILFALLPHAPQPDIISYRVTVGLAVWDAVAVGFAAVLVRTIKKTIGTAYTKAMAWLFWSFIIIGAAGIHFAVIEMILGPGNWYYDGSMTIIPFFIGALTLLRAGYEMAIIPDTTSTPSPSRQTTPTNTNSDMPLIDIVVYLASLASVPGEIDTMLDTLRQVTSRSEGSGHVLGTRDREALAGVCRNLVGYLTAGERLRNYTVEELHFSVQREFNLSDADVRKLLHW